METKKEKKEVGSMDDAIASIAGILKKHCKERCEIESFVNCITSANEYLFEMLSPRPEIIYDFREIEDILRKNGSDKLLTTFREISGVLTEGMILIGHIRPGNELIYKMSDEFHSLIY